MSQLDEQKEDIKYVKHFDSYYSMKQQPFHEQLFLSNGDENMFNINIVLFPRTYEQPLRLHQKEPLPNGLPSCPCENAAGLPSW